MPLNPAAEKLPLAVKKNLRDEWEAKKPEFEQRLSDLLGEKWTITTDQLLIYSNVEDASYQSRMGTVITWYMKPLVENFEKFLMKFGDDGKAEINTVVTSHTVHFGPQEWTSFRYGGLHVEDGILKLVYEAPTYFASNVDDASSKIAEALQKANASRGGAFDVVARNSVKDKYDSEIGPIQAKIGDLVAVKDIKLNGNHAANAQVLSQHKKDWQSSYGQASLSYFYAFASQLDRAGFKNDDMLQEGFQESVTKNEISLLVVDKLEKGGYSELTLADGVLNIRVPADKWWSNVDETGAKILDVL